MEERISGGGGGGGRGDGGEPSSSKARPSYVKLGERQIFAVELRPGETTFVSWKKLMKDANKVSSGSPAPAPEPPPLNAHAQPSLDSRIAPGQPAEKEVKDANPPNRFNAVIEKIERLYMGKDSSDEEDLKDVPDDDQYDTDDSFIDDAELDEYFEVDNAAIKHDGFFVNRGKLEQINEPTGYPNQQPKKRRIKDVTKAPGESDDGGLSNKHAKIEVKNSEKPKTGVLSKGLTEKSKDSSGLSDGSRPRYLDKTAYSQTKMQSAKSMNNVDEHDLSVRLKEKNGVRELPDLNIPDGKVPMQAAKTSHFHKKDGSVVRHKSSMLEKAIRELEKMVVESRPPTLENQEVDISSQAIKRRLPREIKLKLAKVARLAQASQGKISKELINRLMSILGHLIQLRTLKRNLKVMISMSLSSKQEKDDRFQQIKKEVVEIIKTRVPSLVLEQQPGVSDDFQETGPKEKGALKRKLGMDAVLEDKICELYDLFVDGLDEDAGPQVRKLYVELAGLWPIGFMDNHGIKHAICRAKERRRAMYNRHKDQEKIKRKKMLASGMEETVRVDAASMAQSQFSQERLPTDTGGPVLALASQPIPSSSTSAVWAPGSAVNTSNVERLKHEKPKGNSSCFMDEAKIGADGPLTKKMVKRKPEHEFDETHLRLEKLHPQPSEERNKSLKQPSGFNQKLNLQLAAPPSCEQSS